MGTDSIEFKIFNAIVVLFCTYVVFVSFQNLLHGLKVYGRRQIAKREEAEDEHLVELIKRGDQKGFKTLVDKYTGLMVEYASSLVSNPDYSVDIVQDSFIDVYHKIRSFDGKKPLKPWILEIVKRKSTSVNYNLQNDLTYGLTDNYEYHFKQNTNNQLAEIIRTLPVYDQKLILMRYQDFYTFQEIAQETGRDESEVRKQFKRAMDRLRTRVSESKTS